MEARTQELIFPNRLPEAALNALFSKKNIDKALTRSRKSAPKVQNDIVLSPKRPIEPESPVVPEAKKTSAHFQSMVTTRLQAWGLGSRVDYVNSHSEELHTLFSRVKELGGYYRVLAQGLWTALQGELGDNARQVYEDFLSCVDTSLHASEQEPNPNHWPPSRLSHLQAVPSVCRPETRKELKRLFALPCFILRSQDPKDLQKWSSQHLRFCALQSTTQPLLDPVRLDNSQYFGLPLLCLNSGSEPITVRLDAIEGVNGPDQPQYYQLLDPGDVLFLQGNRVIVLTNEFSVEGQIVLLHGLIQYLPRLAVAMELAKLKEGLLKDSVYVKTYELLMKDTSLLSDRSRFMLSQCLMQQIEDWNGEETEAAVISVCSDCKRPLAFLGRKCACEHVLCQICRLKSDQHVCQWKWVRVGFASPVQVRSNLQSILQIYLSTIPTPVTPVLPQSNGYTR